MMICKMKNINKSFGKRVIFNNLNLFIEHGEFVCVAGKSGTGKSTLIHIIGGLDYIDSGSIELCGVKGVLPNTKKSQRLLKNNIGFLFQNYGLIEDKSIKYNLDIVCNKNRSSSKEQKKVLLSLNLDIPLERKIHTLSGGEQQRVALARIILKDCDLILADEPTASLDDENAELVLDVLNSLNTQGKTIILVTHSEKIKNLGYRILEL